MTEQSKVKAVKVKLNQAHTHRGKEYKKDDVIEVLPHSAGYIVERKIGSRL